MRRAAILLLLLALAGPGLADYRDAYRSGITDGLDRENWGELANRMREAIQEQPQASKKKIKLYGTRFSPYVPHYYLGLALYNSGDLEGALRAWEISASQGATSALAKSERRIFEERLGELRGQLAQAQPTPTEAEPDGAEPAVAAAAVQQAVGSAEKAVADAEKIASEVGTLAADPVLKGVWNRERTLGPSLEEAKAKIDQARRGIASGRSAGDVSALQTAGRQAEEAGRQLAGVRTAARTRRQALVAEQEAGAAEAELAQARAAAARELDRANQARETVRALAQDELLADIWARDEKLGVREGQAQELLGRAADTLQRGTQTKSGEKLAQARDLAAQARQQFEAVARLAPARKSEIQLARQEEEDRRQREQEARMDEVERANAIRQSLRELDRRAEEALEQLREQQLESSLESEQGQLLLRRQEASALPGDASPDQLAQARDDLDGAIKGLLQGIATTVAAAAEATGPPSELLAAARAYFRADYDRAVRLLTDVSFSDDRATAQAHLFRAAARYSLFLVGGEEDARLREGSESEIRALYKVDPALAPDETAFSPRFGRFFSQVVAAL